MNVRSKKTGNLISNSINKSKMSDQRLNLHQNPNLLHLKKEMEYLEIILNNLINEKADLEKILGEFQYRQSMELGGLLLQILKIKMTNLKNIQEFKKAESDYNSYNNQFENNIKIIKQQLGEAESLELKINYRKACQLCHPDKVSEELKVNAAAIFNELKKAYIINDLKRVNEILRELNIGNPFKIITKNHSEIAYIQIHINKLKKEISELEHEIEGIKKSEIYKTIAAIDNWEIYFINTRKFLEIELLNLQKK
jgi:hypothetical protein